MVLGQLPNGTGAFRFALLHDVPRKAAAVAMRHPAAAIIVPPRSTADPERNKSGRELGYTRFDKMAEALGCHGEYVERPGDIRPALERAAAAVASGTTSVVNVVTDWSARASMAPFTSYMT